MHFADRLKSSDRSTSPTPFLIGVLHHGAEELSFKDKLALFILFVILECFVVLPADCLFALPTSDVTDNVTTCCHAALRRLAGFNIHHGVEEIGLAMLPTEVL